ncbi:MAG: asparagine synthase (glutamine-hydrolyzing) [Candidatus Bathyarchaeia archaeon]
MCGIAGLHGEFASKEIVLRMLETIKHRGRDDQGVFAEGHVGIGCNRLSIIDVAGGHQPLSNEEGTIWLVQNGEIYNYQALREALHNAGHRLQTQSDTEAIAHAYEEWGPDCFKHLKGIFAIALWDGTNHTLHLARDRVGIKPLYYAQAQGGLLFASEYKAILAAGLLDSLTVNQGMVDQLLEVGYPLEPETLLNEVHQVPPGSRLEVHGGNVREVAFWTPPGLSDYVPDESIVRNTLKDSVISQTITSDVPVGAFLSGGLDTSTVVAFASRVRPDGLKTFCMGFKEPTDEFKDARVVAETFGTEHHEIIVDASQAMEIFPRMVWHSEAPKVNLYSWFVNEAASKYVKVCLSGLGGDELFGGYPSSTRFGIARKISKYRRGPIPALSRFADLIPSRRVKYAGSLRTESLAYATLITALPRNEISPRVKDLTSHYFDKGASTFEQSMTRAEFHTKLPYDYLLVEDAMSMAHTLEVRVPLLHDDLLELMMPVAYRHNVNGTQGKRLLRAAVRDILPPRCLSKEKWGFSVNVFSWWKNSVREYAIKRIPDSNFLKANAPKWHDKITAKIQSTPEVRNSRWYSMAWIMLGLDYWSELFLEAQTPKAISP